MPASVYFKLDRDVTPLSDHVLIFNMEKGDKLTKGGILIADDNGKDRGIRPRWCQVYKAGANVDYVKDGDWILVEHGRWTFGVETTLTKEDGTKEEIYLQRVDTDGIMLVQEERPDWI